jgi:hypothetical protein
MAEIRDDIARQCNRATQVRKIDAAKVQTTLKNAIPRITHRIQVIS